MDIYYQNCRSLRNKLLNFKLNALERDHDLICLTETWFNDSINNSEIIDDRYIVIRKDRNLNITNKVDGGGVAILVKKSLIISELEDINDIFDNIWVRMKTKNGKFLIICLVYFPSNGSKLEHYEAFCNKLSNMVLESPRDSLFLILGDFNLPRITWNTDYEHVTPNPLFGRCANQLLETLVFTDLKQHNLVMNSNNRILDLVVSNIELKKINVTISNNALTKIDVHHPPIEIRVETSLVKCLPVQHLAVPNLRRLNYTLMKILNWNSFFLGCNVDKAVEMLYDKLNGYVTKNCRPKYKAKFPAWYSIKLIKLVNLKQKYHNLHRKFKQPNDYVIFSNLRKRVKFEIRKCFTNYTNYIEKSIKSNPKLLWSYSQSLTTRSTYPSCMRLGHGEANEAYQISNLYADHFESVFIDDTIDALCELGCTHSCNDYIDLISSTDVFNVLASLDTKKGAGPDNLTNYFIYQLKSELKAPLTYIFNLSLKLGIFPSYWKIAYLVPVFKNGDASDIRNYRPISILNSFSKIFEKLVYGIIFNEVKCSINSTQHGFYPKRSTTTNLIDFSSFVFNIVDYGGQVDCIYTDFEKAFDTVSHSVLLRKCDAIGLSTQIIYWLKSYLSARVLQVKFNGFLSKSFIAKSGVPQGSTLGPLLFLIFINDVSSVLACQYLLYADDLKLFTNIRTSSDCFMLQTDLRNLNNWSNLNKLKLNFKKCVVVSYSRKVVTLQY